MGKKKPKEPCQAQMIEFDTEDGVVRFVGRPGGSRECPLLRRPEPTAAQDCASDLFSRAVGFCKATSCTGLQHKLCVAPTMRHLSAAVRCKEQK